MPRVQSAGEAEAFRRRLVEAAEGLIVGRKSIDFTMRELAAAVGCSPMLPYRYFRDKEDLVAAVRANAFDRFAAALEAPPPAPAAPASRSQGVGDAYVAFAFANPELYRLMFDSVPPEPGRWPDLEQAGARAKDTMSAHVRDLVAQGFIHGDPVVIGHLFWAGLHGLIMLQLGGQLSPEPGFDALRSAFMRSLVFGLRTPLP